MTGTTSVAPLYTTFENCIVLPMLHCLSEMCSYDQKLPVARSCLALENCAEFPASAFCYPTLSPSEKLRKFLARPRVARYVLILKLVQNCQISSPLHTALSSSPELRSSAQLGSTSQLSLLS